MRQLSLLFCQWTNDYTVVRQTDKRLCGFIRHYDVNSTTLYSYLIESSFIIKAYQKSTCLILYTHGKNYNFNIQTCISYLFNNAVNRSVNYLYTQSSGSKQEERAKGVMNLALRSIFVHTCKWFLTCRKSYDMGPLALLPLRRKACCGFLSLRPGLNPRTLGPMASTLTITSPRRLRFVVI